MNEEIITAIDETPEPIRPREIIKTVRHVHRMGHEDWVRQRLAAMGRLDAMPVEITPGVAVAARVDHGRWIVDCPFCPGAEYLDLDDPRFFCSDGDCLNKGAPGKWVAVLVPEEDERLAIEAALLERPERERHWRPGLTVADLQTENILHERW